MHPAGQEAARDQQPVGLLVIWGDGSPSRWVRPIMRPVWAFGCEPIRDAAGNLIGMYYVGFAAGWTW